MANVVSGPDAPVRRDHAHSVFLTQLFVVEIDDDYRVAAEFLRSLLELFNRVSGAGGTFKELGKNPPFDFGRSSCYCAGVRKG
jgi:hypothetical protein